MSNIRGSYEAMQGAFGPRPYTEFMLAHGREYKVGPHSYSLPRGEPNQCYANAGRLAIDMPHLTYVEGQILVCGLPLDHAWCIDEAGIVVETTIRDHDHVSEFYGVPFRTDYLLKAVIKNKMWGVLDCATSPRTAPKLFELGLDAGQQWLLANKRRRA